MGASVGIATILGAIIGFIKSSIHPDHAHQIIPSWLIFAVVGMVVALVLCLIVSTVMLFVVNTNWQKSTLYTTIGVIVTLLGFFLFSR